MADLYQGYFSLIRLMGYALVSSRSSFLVSCLFMLTRLIGGNRVITLGTAIEQHFLTTQNWGMGATIGVVLIVAMIATMWLTKERRQ